MDQRHLAAYAILLLIVLALAAGALAASRRWRRDRRESLRFQREQSRRRAEARAGEG